MDLKISPAFYVTEFPLLRKRKETGEGKAAGALCQMNGERLSQHSAPRISFETLGGAPCKVPMPAVQVQPHRRELRGTA